MKLNTDKIKEQLKDLINKSNTLLNSSQNKQQVTAYLYIIFSLAALSFFGLFAIGPTLTTISQLNKQYEEDKVALKQLEEKNAALRSLNSQYIDIQEDLDLIDKAIPESPKVAELTRQLEFLANRNSLIVRKLDTGLMELFPAKNVTSPVLSFSFSISVAGAEQDVNTFISNVINMERIIGIDRLTTGSEQGDFFLATLTGKAYLYRP